MAIDIYKTQTMLAAIEQMKPVTAFLRDRYFPHSDSDIFPGEEVLVEFKDSTGRKMAPVVLPRKGSISGRARGLQHLQNGAPAGRALPPADHRRPQPQGLRGGSLL